MSRRRRGFVSWPTWQSSQANTVSIRSSPSGTPSRAIAVIRSSIAANVSPMPMATWMRSASTLFKCAVLLQRALRPTQRHQAPSVPAGYSFRHRGLSVGQISSANAPFERRLQKGQVMGEPLRCPRLAPR